jgi:hypothetical protein
MPAIYHMVLLQFQNEVSEESISDAYAQLASLQEKIPGIVSFQGGPYSSHEGLNQGFTHGFLMVFENAEARDVYLPHPEHERVKAAILPLVEDFVAFDFEE